MKFTITYSLEAYVLLFVSWDGVGWRRGGDTRNTRRGGEEGPILFLFRK